MYSNGTEKIHYFFQNLHRKKTEKIIMIDTASSRSPYSLMKIYKHFIKGFDLAPKFKMDTFFICHIVSRHFNFVAWQH
jgi:hypothetical protein